MKNAGNRGPGVEALQAWGRWRLEAWRALQRPGIPAQAPGSLETCKIVGVSSLRPRGPKICRQRGLREASGGPALKGRIASPQGLGYLILRAT